MPAGEVDYVENDSPGFIAAKVAIRSSYINGRLRKRYGNGLRSDSAANNLPLGQTAPLLVAAGTNPPAVTLQGRPTLGSLQMLLQITTGGPVGTAIFKWSADGGVTFTSNVSTAATVVLGTTGMTAFFPTGTYGTDNQYAAATPVPEIVLGWLTLFVTYDAYKKRGYNPADPMMVDMRADLENAMAELKEAADGENGLFDLPGSEDLDSAIATGYPLGYSETSPYIWTDYERNIGRNQDTTVTTSTGGVGDNG